MSYFPLFYSEGGLSTLRKANFVKLFSKFGKQWKIECLTKNQTKNSPSLSVPQRRGNIPICLE